MKAEPNVVLQSVRGQIFLASSLQPPDPISAVRPPHVYNRNRRWKTSHQVTHHEDVTRLF